MYKKFNLVRIELMHSNVILPILKKRGSVTITKNDPNFLKSRPTFILKEITNSNPNHQGNRIKYLVVPLSTSNYDSAWLDENNRQVASILRTQLNHSMLSNSYLMWDSIKVLNGYEIKGLWFKKQNQFCLTGSQKNFLLTSFLQCFANFI